MAEASESRCPHCNDLLVPGKMYCPNCGLALLPSDQKTAIDAYIAAKVAQEVALKTQDESSVVRSIANDAEDEIWKRLKRYAWLGALALFLLGLYGFNSIRDAKQKIVDEARSRVEPVVKDVEQRAQAGQAKLADVEKRLPKLTESLNKTSELADQQRKRIEGQGAEVTAKLNKFTAATTRAEQLSASFEAKVADAQRRLAELTKRYDTQLNQISRAVTHTAVSEAFPNLDQEPFIAIGNDRFDRIVKKPDEKWVNIYITQPAQAAKLITSKRLEDLVSELRAAGFTPLFNTIQIGGRLGGIIERAGQGPYDASAVLYFHPEFKSSAEQLTSITAKYLSLPPGSPELADPRQMEQFRKVRLELLIKDAKLDAQVFIAAPQ